MMRTIVLALLIGCSTPEPVGEITHASPNCAVCHGSGVVQGYGQDGSTTVFYTERCAGYWQAVPDQIKRAEMRRAYRLQLERARPRVTLSGGPTLRCFLPRVEDER